MHAATIACVFPGQGSQAPGMLTPWQGNRVLVDTLAEASDALDQDLWSLIESGPASQLNDTINTQPAMVASSVALFRVWQQATRCFPTAAAGHSVGELSALTAAGVFELSQVMRLVRERARSMADALPSGVAGMAAVLGLDDLAVQALCQACAQDDVLEPVNYNAPGQVVVAGHVGAIERLKPAAKAMGAKMVFVLPVSGPFHSSLMGKAAARFAAHLATARVGVPVFDVIHNSNQGIAAPDTIRPCLAAQLTRPVNWVQTVRQLQLRGVTHVVEIGPGEVLTNLIKRIAPELQAFPVNTPSALDKALAKMLSTN